MWQLLPIFRSGLNRAVRFRVFLRLLVALLSIVLRFCACLESAAIALLENLPGVRRPAAA